MGRGVSNRIIDSHSQVNERMTEKKVSEPAVLMTTEEFSKRFPVSSGRTGRGKNVRNEQALALIETMLKEKKSGYVVINDDPFFGSGIVLAMRKKFPNDKMRMVSHWFDTKDSDVRAEVQKYTKQKGRFLVQIELV